MSSIPAKVDVVVAGSGATGLAAAVTLCEGGASVALFEKQRSLGGTSNFFHGTFAVESQMQREQFIDYSRDEAFKNIMEYSHWMANARLVRAIVDESAATIAWLRGSGRRVHRPDDQHARRSQHLPRGQGRWPGGGHGPGDPGQEQGRPHPARDPGRGPLQRGRPHHRGRRSTRTATRWRWRPRRW